MPEPTFPATPRERSARRTLGHVHGVCFDMDGLLVETESLWFRAETSVMAGLGAEWTLADQAHCLGGPLTRVGAYMAATAGRGDPEQIVADMVDAVEALVRAEPPHWMPGARELLVSLQDAGVPHSLVTASPRRLATAVLDALTHDLGATPFDAVLTANDTERTKPYPDPYLAACRAIAVAPENAVVLEDSANGARAAVAAGCMVLAVPHMAPVDPAPRLATVRSLHEVTLETIPVLTARWA